MSVRDAEPGDIYVDAQSNVWFVEAVCPEPSVQMRCVLTGEKRNAGVAGLLWKGFRKVDLPEPTND